MEKKTILRLKPWVRNLLEDIGSLFTFVGFVFILMLVSGRSL